MTGSDLTTRIMKRLGDDPDAPTANQFYRPSEILVALNQLQRLFVLFTLCLETTASFQLDGSPCYRMLTFFPDWIVPLRVRLASGAKLKPSRLTDLAALDRGWIVATGTTSRYAHLGMDFFAVYKASSALLKVTYARCPIDLLSEAEPEIPEQYHPSLISGAIPLLRIKEGQQEWQKTLPLWAEFMGAVNDCRAEMRARNQAQGYDALPVELKYFDRSHVLQEMRLKNGR